MVVEDLEGDGDDHEAGESAPAFAVELGEPPGIDASPDLEERELLVGAPDEYRADPAVRHDDCPVVVHEKLEKARDQLRDLRPHPGIRDHFVRDGQTEQNAAVLVAGGVADPEVLAAI